MKISKYVHSCLLIEEQDKTILIDPGNYTAEEKILNISRLEKLDFVLITHEHQDHLDITLIQELVRKFPETRLISNSSVTVLLEKEGLVVSPGGNDFIVMEDVPHEKLLGRAAPQNTLFHLFGKLTHPGDSLQFTSTAEILALPIQAPWGSMVQAVERAAELKPKIVIPIHDWHWSEKARERLYGMAADYLRGKGIDFKGLETGVPVDL